MSTAVVITHTISDIDNAFGVNVMTAMIVRAVVSYSQQLSHTRSFVHVIFCALQSMCMCLCVYVLYLPVETKLFPKKLMRAVGQAVMQWGMIEEGDRLLLGVSGGKDSLSLLHVLLHLQKRAPVNFTIGCATVDPQTPSFDPSPLKAYMAALQVPYFYLSENIIERAACEMTGDSICSYCSRMKRGLLYTCCRKQGYNKLVLAQHLDDLVESFLMSAMHNGQLRTMKAKYWNDQRDVQIIRPLAYVREASLKKFAYDARLPVINENCPACFEEPKERHRVKKMLSQEESLIAEMHNSMRRALLPLMD